MYGANESILVEPSGAVGKVVVTPGIQRTLVGVQLVGTTVSAGFIEINEGITSATGEMFSARVPVNDSKMFHIGCLKFANGLHARVTPAGAKAYLLFS